jgi:DNA-binding beta-propeller fold protein YncE
MSNYFKCTILIGLTFLVSGCEPDEEPNQPSVSYDYSTGILIVNEGPFNNGTGTITYVKPDGSAIKSAIFQEANNAKPLGSIAQSLAVVGEKAYILINNSNKIEVVNHQNFKSIASIENIELPRYMVQVSETKAYVTCWDGKIKVLNTEKDEVYTEIEGRFGQEKLLKVDPTAWVLNQGGYGVDSTISVININTNMIDTTIHIFARPTGICEDKNGLVWVMCAGSEAYHPGGATQGHLVAISKTDYSIKKDFIFPDSEKHPFNLIINAGGDELFYVYPGGINRFQINEDTLILTPFISYEGAFYSIGYDLMEDYIYASDVLDYVQNGQVFVYDALSGIEERTFKAGIVPTFFYFPE